MCDGAPSHRLRLTLDYKGEPPWDEAPVEYYHQGHLGQADIE